MLKITHHIFLFEFGSASNSENIQSNQKNDCYQNGLWRHFNNIIFCHCIASLIIWFNANIINKFNNIESLVTIWWKLVQNYELTTWRYWLCSGHSHPLWAYIFCACVHVCLSACVYLLAPTCTHKYADTICSRASRSGCQLPGVCRWR